MKLTVDELRIVGAWAADCAERVLPIFEMKAPSDVRPREAISGIREFARGDKRTARLRSLALAALAAAREVGDSAAAAAARSAGCAASSAYTRALPQPHHAKHVLSPPAHAAQARELAASADPKAAVKEVRWAVRRASPIVGGVAQKWPPRVLGWGRFNDLLHKVDMGLRRDLRQKQKRHLAANTGPKRLWILHEFPPTGPAGPAKDI